MKEVYHQALFRPTILSIAVNPFYFARKGLYNAIQSFSSEVTGRILDVGCGDKPYQHLFNSSEYIGLEIDSEGNRENKKADYFYDGYTFPFETDVFTAVVCNQVLEHVFDPIRFLSEINRCLKPGGKLLLSVPFVWDEHEAPQDFARYSSFGIKYLLEKENFEIIEQRKTISDVRVIFQLLSAYFYKTCIGQRNYIQKNILIVLFIFPINLIGEVLGIILPNNKDLYLDNIILARKL